MKFQDRQFVEGTEPAVYIGHRIRTEADGTETVSPMWYAEYCLHNRQRFEGARHQQQEHRDSESARHLHPDSFGAAGRAETEHDTQGDHRWVCRVDEGAGARLPPSPSTSSSPAT